MHNVHGLVGQLVGFSDSLVAHHLDDESAVGFVVLILKADFTALDCTIST
jgi:hypothetical protein